MSTYAEAGAYLPEDVTRNVLVWADRRRLIETIVNSYYNPRVEPKDVEGIVRLCGFYSSCSQELLQEVVDEINTAAEVA